MLHFEVYGRGTPLVLLAGFASDLQTWTFHRDALAERHRLILIDNRGAGRSPSEGAPYSTAGMAEDVRQVLERAGVERACVLGHSLGGAIAQELALLCPERVQRLILVSTFARGTSTALDVLAAWRRGLAEPEVIAREVLPWLYSESYLAHPHRVQAILGFLRANRFPPTPQGLDGQLAALRQHDTRARLAQIACPTLVICGGLDRLTPPALSAELADGIAAAEKPIILPSAGHVCMLEQVETFSATVLGFCKP